VRKTSTLSRILRAHSAALPAAWRLLPDDRKQSEQPPQKSCASAIQRDELRKITLQRELQHANAEWKEQMRRDPQFDPKGKKVRARLREISEASVNGKPIPPNPWQSSGQQKQTANETERPQPNQNPPPQ